MWPNAQARHRDAMTITTTHTKPDPKIETVQRLYEAYGRGDVDAVLADIADDVEWAAEAAGVGVPWWGPHDGKAEVPRFFAEIASNVEVTSFDVVSLMSNQDNVIATIHWSYTVKATGKSATMYMQHWWRFADGRIVSFRGSEDTEQSARAFS
jgi:ketosteroid isomerase-like protein